jgi:hypothetical protein
LFGISHNAAKLGCSLVQFFNTGINAAQRFVLA